MKVKPGKAVEQAEFTEKLAAKGAAAILESGRATGFVYLRRVFPLTSEAGHDSLYFYVSQKPPALDAPYDDSFDKAIGMTREQFLAKRVSLVEIVKAEIWSNVYMHGKIEKGDFVRIRSFSPPDGKTADYLRFVREYESKIRATLVKNGSVPGLHLWQVRFTDSVGHQFLDMAVHKDSESLYRSYGSQTKTFEETFPTGTTTLTFSSSASSGSAGVRLLRPGMAAR